MPFLKTDWLLPCALLIASCSRESTTTNSSQSPIIANTESTSAQMSRLSLSNTRGHVVASWEHSLDEEITFKSLQQPEASYQVLNDKQLVLSELKPQHHDIVIKRKKDSALSFAVFKAVLIEAGMYVELGLPAFQSPGSVSGRVFSSTTDAPVTKANVRIKELNLETQTDTQGLFAFEDLPAGTWNIAVHTPELGVISNTEITVTPEARTELGDLWLGARFTSVQPPVLLNGENGIISESEARIKVDAPHGARFIAVVTQQGETLISRIPIQRIIAVPFKRPMATTLMIRFLNDKERTMGTQTLYVEFDPFAIDGKRFEYIVEVENRIVKSPNRTFQFRFTNTPESAARIRFSHAGNIGNWLSPQETLNYTLPKSNLSCGQHQIGIELENESGFRSKKLEIPVTLSCWERMPHRPAIEKVIGIDNAAVWTGTHAFVWSGKQFDSSRRTSIWGGSNSAETVMVQEELHTYSYLDSGYVFKPNFDASNQLARPSLEPIITDWAPKPRTGTGIAGLNNSVAVYGGEDGVGPIADGAIFNIEANGWVSMMSDGAPSARIKPSVSFVSEHEVLVWGGYTRTDLGYELPLNDGAIYDINTHRWRKISTENAPGARMKHVGVWTGTNFFVFGGVLPGNIEQLKNYKYNPETDTWTLLKQNTYDSATDTWNEPESSSTPLTHMSAVHSGDLILFYGRDQRVYIYGISEDKELISGRLTTPDPNDSSLRIPLPNHNDNPAMVVTEHPQNSDKKVVSIFGGSASGIDSDTSKSFLVMVVNNSGTKPAEMIDSINSSINIQDLFPPAKVNSKPISSCCVDFLAFNANNHIFAINGTEVSNTSVYTNITTSTRADSSTSNYSSTLYAHKSHNSRAIKHADDLSSITTHNLDLPENTTNSAPLGPYFLYNTSKPVVYPDKNQLVFYGGIYADPYEIKYQQGGFIYDINSKAWQHIPVAPSEPTYEDGQSISRFDTINFISNGILYLLGGWRFEATLKNYLFSALKSNLNTNEDATPISFTPTSSVPSESFDYMPLAQGVADPLHTNQFCQVDGKVLLSGGLRKQATSETPEPALLQDKVVFDSSEQKISKPAADPLGVRAAPTVVALDNGCFLWGGYAAENATHTDSNLAATLESIRTHFTAKSDGSIYTFSSDSWSPVSTMGSPSARAFMHGLWSGSEVILWGGRTNTMPSTESKYDGMKGVWSYSPASNTWTAHAAQLNEPRFHGEEQPVWTGRHMFIFKPVQEEYSYQYTLSENSWKKLPMPSGFNFGAFAYWGTHTTWIKDQLFVMPYYDKSPALMGLFVPPDP